MVEPINRQSLSPLNENVRLERESCRTANRSASRRSAGRIALVALPCIPAMAVGGLIAYFALTNAHLAHAMTYFYVGVGVGGTGLVLFAINTVLSVRTARRKRHENNEALEDYLNTPLTELHKDELLLVAKHTEQEHVKKALAHKLNDFIQSAEDLKDIPLETLKTFLMENPENQFVREKVLNSDEVDADYRFELIDKYPENADIRTLNPTSRFTLAQLKARVLEHPDEEPYRTNLLNNSGLDDAYRIEILERNPDNTEIRKLISLRADELYATKKIDQTKAKLMMLYPEKMAWAIERAMSKENILFFFNHATPEDILLVLQELEALESSELNTVINCYMDDQWRVEYAASNQITDDMSNHGVWKYLISTKERYERYVTANTSPFYTSEWKNFLAAFQAASPYNK